MKITLITATYDSEKNIADCLQSVARQTYNNIEYIVIDAGSTDGTIRYIERSKLVNKIISEPDKGIYDALNKGIKMASGDIIGFLHSDDLLNSKNTLSNIQKVFQETDADGVFGDLLLINKKNINKTVRKWKSQNFQTKLLERGWMPAHPTLFLKKKVYEKHKLFDLSYKISADYDFMLRIFSDTALKFVYLPIVITKMRVGGASNGSFKKFIQKTIEDYQALKKNNISSPIVALFMKKISKIIQYI